MVKPLSPHSSISTPAVRGPPGFLKTDPAQGWSNGVPALRQRNSRACSSLSFAGGSSIRASFASSTMTFPRFDARYLKEICLRPTDRTFPLASITEATVMDAKGKVRSVGRKQISFKYRASNLGNVIVLEAKLALIEEPPAKLKELQARLFRWRKAGTPFDQPCAGSVFKNPGGPRTAGVLIDECGLKGFTIGGAQVSTLHANYIVNTGTATASDVLKVIDHVRKTVAKKTGVELELEVKVIGA